MGIQKVSAAEFLVEGGRSEQVCRAHRIYVNALCCSDSDHHACVHANSHSMAQVRGAPFSSFSVVVHH